MPRFAVLDRYGSRALIRLQVAQDALERDEHDLRVRGQLGLAAMSQFMQSRFGLPNPGALVKLESWP